MNDRDDRDNDEFRDADDSALERRRIFCKVCIGGLSVVSAGMVGFPVISFLARPQTLPCTIAAPGV